ncbi:MAG: DUF4142 domain-containing protein, partial [Rhodospirillales bacterium]|nr:DUF4142 domain-containing protein [Rhodospirillales bacterium]
MRTTRPASAAFATLPLAAALLLAVAAPARAELTGVDRDFATQAQRANIAAIQDAQWGEKSTASEPLKQLAQKIIKNRTTASAELKTLAQQQNFSLPPLPTGGQQEAAAALRDKRGSEL